MWVPQRYVYDPQKDAVLRSQRGIGFQDMIDLIETGQPFNKREHPNQNDYPGQHLIEIKGKDYVYVVPSIIKGDTLVMKTIYPSRKALKRWRQYDSAE